MIKLSFNFRFIPLNKSNSRRSPLEILFISLNGVELHSPLSQNSIFYGPIQEIEILDSGKDYSIVNPPNISVIDSNGSNCELYPAFSGKISKLNYINEYSKSR